MQTRAPDLKIESRVLRQKKVPHQTDLQTLKPDSDNSNLNPTPPPPQARNMDRTTESGAALKVSYIPTSRS